MDPDDFKIATDAATRSTSMTTSSALFHIATAAATTFISQIAASTTHSSPASTTSSSIPPGDDESTGECELLGPFAILVQGALGALALLSLVYKRWRERPQRPVKVWAFDASKQVFGTVLLHMANLMMSLFSSGQIQAIAKVAADKVKAESTYRPNPCSFYLLNLAIDTTIGIPILLIILKVLHVGASFTPLASPPESIKSGYYGDPPRATWWLKQSIIYFIGLIGMKICVFIIFELCPWIVMVGDWALRWTEGNEAIQIAFVMLIFPLIMNALQYYIIDTFIKGKPAKEDEEGETGRARNDDEQGGLLAGDHTSHGDSIDEDEAYKADVGRDDAKAEAQSDAKEVYGTRPQEEEQGSGESSTPSSAGEREVARDPPRI